MPTFSYVGETEGSRPPVYSLCIISGECKERFTCYAKNVKQRNSCPRTNFRGDYPNNGEGAKYERCANYGSISQSRHFRCILLSSHQLLSKSRVRGANKGSGALGTPENPSRLQIRPENTTLSFPPKTRRARRRRRTQY